jgi:transcriptional regulator with XRE-family HTH domain
LFRQKRRPFKAQLAELCDISRKYITEIDTENKAPSFTRFEHLADALGVEPYELLLHEERGMTIDQRDTLIGIVTSKIHEAVDMVEDSIVTERSSNDDSAAY